MGWLIDRFPAPTAEQLAKADEKINSKINSIVSNLESALESLRFLGPNKIDPGDGLNAAVNIAINKVIRVVPVQAIRTNPLWENKFGIKTSVMLYQYFLNRDSRLFELYWKKGLLMKVGAAKGRSIGTTANDSISVSPLATDKLAIGFEGNDVITVEKGGNKVYADLGPGNDIFNGGKGSDNVYGGAGGDLLSGGAGSDVLDGGADDDQLFGGADNDLLGGGTGNDVLSGDMGDDLLDGGEGNDVMIGGEGADVLTGLGGSDTYRFTKLGDSRLGAIDRITDLVIGVDVLDAPTAVTANNLKELGSISALTEAGIQALLGASGSVLGESNFAANQAATFSYGAGSAIRTFLAVNDGTKGFNARVDMLVEITNYSGALANLEII